MPRTIWKGLISFGLVEIPVGLYPALRPDEISFSLLDKRDVSPVGYKRVNKTTGEEVPKEDIARGYEVERGHFVLLDEEDFRRANVEATRSIDILHFVEGSSIDPRLFDKPYYVAPLRRGSKAYALLRAALERSGKVGVAQVVIRSRQYLAAVLVRDEAIVVEILRYPHELRDMDDLELPEKDLEALGVRSSELKMAERLIAELTEPFEPTKYRDEYRDDLLALIKEKTEEGKMAAVRPPTAEEPVEAVEPVDLMALLRRSIEREGNGARKVRRDAGRHATPPPKDGGRRQETRAKQKSDDGERGATTKPRRGGSRSRGAPKSNGGKETAPSSAGKSAPRDRRRGRKRGARPTK